MLWRFRRWLLRPLIHELHFGVQVLQEIAMTSQEKVDAIADAITTATTNIRQDIADLKSANPAVDFTKLEASVSGLTALDLENPVAPPTAKK